MKICAVFASIWAELRRPSIGAGWYAWATNQAGHAFVVGFPMALAYSATSMRQELVPISVAMTYFGLWELLVQNGKRPKDALNDTGFVFLGAAAMVWPIAWFAFIVALGFGVVRRIGRG